MDNEEIREPEEQTAEAGPEVQPEEAEGSDVTDTIENDARPDAPEEAEDTAQTGDDGAPEKTGEAEDPEGPEESEKPAEPDAPEESERPEGAEKPAEPESPSEPGQPRRKRLRVFRNVLIIAWAVALIAGLCVWQITGMKNTAAYLKSDTKSVLKSFLALDADDADNGLYYLEQDLADFNRKAGNPFWRLAGAVFKRDMDSAKLLAGSLQTAEQEILRPAAELLRTCPPQSAEAVEPWLDLFNESMPVLDKVSRQLDGIDFRFYDSDGRIRGYVDELAYFTRVLELADEDFVQPAVSLMATTPVSRIKTGDGYDFNALGRYLDFLARSAPKLAQTIKGISPEELSKIDTDGRLGALCSQASELADFGARLTASVVAPAAELLQAEPLTELTVEGGFNARLIRHYADLLTEIMPKAHDLTAEFYSLDLSSLDKDGKITGLVDKISALLEKYGPAEEYLPLLQILMGDGEDRTYVFPVQNTSEIRASGGFPGSVGLITIRDGILTFGTFSGVHDFFSRYVTGRYNLTSEEKTMFSNNMILTWDACYCPNFERAGQIFSYATEDKLKIPIDGAVSMTPAVLQEVLKIFGDVTTFDGTVLNGDNATKIIQRDIYFWYYGYGSMNNLYAADSFFGDAARKTMELVKSNLNKDNILELVDLFRRGSEKRMIMLWMADEEEEEIVKAAGCSGGMYHDRDKPVHGMYFSGFNACKLGWWFGAFPTVSEPVVNPDGSRTYDITLTVENNLTWNEYSRASVDFITSGDGVYCMFAHLMAPEGGYISDFSASRWGTYRNEFTYEGLQDLRVTYYIGPGSSYTFSYKVTTAPGVEEPLQIAMTPTLQDYW